jgi:hypothetical protein
MVHAIAPPDRRSALLGTKYLSDASQPRTLLLTSAGTGAALPSAGNDCLNRRTWLVANVSSASTHPYNYYTFYNYDTFAANLDFVTSMLNLTGRLERTHTAIADNIGHQRGSRPSHPFPTIEFSPCRDDFRVVLARPVP